jgi:hypothetical protein
MSDEQHNRIVEALAHVAARGARAPVDALVHDRDTLVAHSAARALGHMAEVRASDAQLREIGPLSDQTVVRGFSRRFYDGLVGDGRVVDRSLPAGETAE